MRSRFKTLAAVAASLMLLPHVAAASENDIDLQQMQDMMLQMQDQMAEQQRVLDAQTQRLEEAGLDERSASSGIAKFFQTVDFGGHISTSYTYSANNNGSGNSNLIGQTAYQTAGTQGSSNFDAAFYQRDSQAFSLDQLWFTADKPATPESRAGFHFDINFGKTSAVHKGTRFFADFSDDLEAAAAIAGSDLQVFTAYISYLAPLGNGVKIDAGRLWTTMGAELVDDTKNWNITRSLVWQMQPVNYTGVHASYEIAGVTLLAGFANDVWNWTNWDTDNNKAVVGQIAWSNDMFGLSGNVVYGSQHDLNDADGDGDITNDGFEGDKRGLVNMVATWDISDAFDVWLDYNYGWTNDRAPGAFPSPAPYMYMHGVALAGRWSFNDNRSGVSVRAEYITGWENLSGTQVVASDVKAYEVTLTGDHMLTNDLMLRGEVRWDQGKRGSQFADNAGDPKKDSVVLLAQLVYSF